MPMSAPARHLSAVPQIEPSTDFPALDDAIEHPVVTHRSRGGLVALVALGAIVIGAVAFIGGRVSAPPSDACLQALDRADIAFTAATVEFGTIEQSALAVIDGELPEAHSIVSDARYGANTIEQIQAGFDTVAAACRAG
jgi:hypothetical protein